MSSSANIMIDLDSLIDTRQGILSKFLEDDKLTELVTSEEYILRERDVFPDIDVDLYNKHYSERDKSTLSNGIVTYVFNIMKIKLSNIIHKATHNQDIKEINLLINFYPYKLTEKETDSIIDVVFQKLGLEIFIKPMWRSPEELNPTFIQNNNIIDLFLYDTNAWCNSNLQLLQATPITKHSIYLPALITNPLTDELKYKFDKTGFKDIHTLMEYGLSPFVVLNYLPILFYCNIITVSAYLEKIKDGIVK